MLPGSRVEICGGIASGKTTLARLLASDFDTLVEEDFKANPFWNHFSRDRKLFQHEKDVCFIAQHTGQVKPWKDKSVVCDYAVFQDLAYATISHDSEHTRIMGALYKHLYGALGPPTMIIRLQCKESVQLQRIRLRGRAQEQEIPATYLKELNDAISNLLRDPPGPVYSIRSDDVDFANDLVAAQCLKEDLLNRLKGLSPGS